jgi:hypothetical protein
MIYQPDTWAYREAWQGEIKAAEQYNEPGRFTAFIGFEWTSNAQANNLHRNVIFRGNGAPASRVVPMVTFKPFGGDNPEDLRQDGPHCADHAFRWRRSRFRGARPMSPVG